MKVFFKFIIFFFVVSINLFPQEINKKIIDEVSGEEILIGECTRDAFKDTTFSGWWNSVYENYDVDSSAIKELKNNIEDISIGIIMGTWCSDSRREVPGFYKIIDALDYPSKGIEMICVNEDKETEGNELEGIDFEFVPTIIFYKNGKELGRIVEFPDETLEKDMVKILTDN